MRPAMELSAEVRKACAWVAARARHVRVREEAIPDYASALPAVEPYPAPAVKERGQSPFFHDLDARAALHLTLDAINFGSGWFPTLRKRPGPSGYYTVASALADRVRAHGPCSRKRSAIAHATVK